MRNRNGRKTTNLATPTARIADYLIYPVTDSVFRRDVFGRVVGEHVVFAAVDATKSEDVPSGLSGLHRKTSHRLAQTVFARTTPLRTNFASEV